MPRLDGLDTTSSMKALRHIHIRATLLALVFVLAAGSGAAYAALRKTPARIGTGVVVIDTQFGYQSAAAAGTGMVLSPSGEVLTNNHVIAGATKIEVVVPGTSHRYAARVVGYDTTNDVAVLQLQDASNLKTVTIAGSPAKLGTRVTAVGNAGGTGLLSVAQGTVTGLDRSITAQDDNGTAERLTGLIETDAALQPGDSGGPLENSAGRVVGMDTAAAAGSPFAAYQGSSDAYAIPISKAVAVAKQIVSGKSSATVHVGGTAFLGIEVGSDPFASANGASIVGVVAGGPAARAGLTGGDMITAVGGKTVGEPTDVASILQAYTPGAKVAIGFADPSGAAQTVTVTLGSGPPQ